MERESISRESISADSWGVDSTGSRRARPNDITIPRIGDPRLASPDERDEHLMLLEAARHALEVEWTETLSVAEAEGDHDLFGYPSMVAYLKHRLRMIGGRAHRYVRLARLARQFSATFSAWKFRQVSSDEAELLFDTARKLPDRYPDAETGLLELVGDSVDETKQVLDYWAAEDERAPLELESQLERRSLEYRRRRNGMVSGRFELPQMAGETFIAALEAHLPPPSPTEERSITQRRADALEDLSRSYLDSPTTPTVGGEKPHLSVFVDYQFLTGSASDSDSTRIHETEDGVVVPMPVVDQIACDASVRRIVFDPTSEVIDVGRKTRVIPIALRRAVIARDRHCVAPGCGRSARWCDVHHIEPWSEDGETELANLCLLCRYHHTLVHLDRLDLSEVVESIQIPAGVGRSP